MKKNSKNNGVTPIVVAFLTALWLVLAGCGSGTENKESNAPANRATDRPNTSDRPAHNHTDGAVYTCPMHPQIVQNEPGSCPICGMDLVRKNPVGTGDSLTIGADLDALLKPTNSVVVANIATVRPEQRSEPVTIDAEGIITYDTRRLFTIPARFGGRIEQLFVRYNYQPIRKGQKLLELYSPDIVTAQRELLYLLTSDATNAHLIGLAKQKLRLLGVTDGQIATLMRTRQPSYSLAVFSPYDGYIVEAASPAPAASALSGLAGASGGGMNGGGRVSGQMSSGIDEITFNSPVPASGNMAGGGASPLLIREGQYVQAGQTLFRVVNTNQLWAEFRLAAREGAGIRVGDPLTITFDQTSQPARRAKVSFVVPFQENGSEFTTIRAKLSGGSTVRVGQLARAEIRRPAAEGLWLPAEAVLDLGNERVVFRQTQPGVFQPVRVQTGARSDGSVVITAGLAADQPVAQNAQFLIDSESFVNVAKTL